jgi:pyrroloquinoline-quinone synthase
MDLKVFQGALDARVSRHQLLDHPFYRAWTAGKLTREQIQVYAAEYFHQVASFPACLSALHSRLGDGSLRRAVLRNLAEEEIEGRAHSDMWLDFAEGVGLRPDQVRRGQPTGAMRRLIERFYTTACADSPSEVLATFYAYESQVPRISGEKACGLVRYYGADARTCGYFALHTYADIRHSQVWRDELHFLVSQNLKLATPALEAAERAARWLWQALDGSEAHRLCRQELTVA